MSNITIYESFQPPLREADITTVERQLGISLPDDYRDFLLTHNGGRPEPDAFPIFGFPDSQSAMLAWFLGISEGEYEDLINHTKVFRDRIPTNLLPIARDPEGNIICLSVSGPDRGKVYYWDHEDEVEEGEEPTYDNVYFVANSFSDLLNSLTELPEPPEQLSFIDDIDGGSPQG